VTHAFGFLIESLVAVLLMVTIGYCVILNKRLKRLKADEQVLKATISELMTATEIAERAVAGLRSAAHECEDTLGERLKAADRFCADLSRQMKSGELVINRLSRIVDAARPLFEGSSAPAPAAPATTDPMALAAAAQIFAQRARKRVSPLAA
jgi:uncharacterized membrane protein